MATSYFLVFQNKTYTAERTGEFLWAPQGSCSHWKSMQRVQKGDVIFHSYRGEIVAVSVAKCACYEAVQPQALAKEALWQSNGWKVDVTYYVLPHPICLKAYMDEILPLQPTKNAPYNRLGRGNTGYLFDLNPSTARFIFNKLALCNMGLAQQIKAYLNL